jgi:hypothetical protein
MDPAALNRYQFMIDQQAPRLYEAAQLGDAAAVQEILQCTKGELPDYVYRRALEQNLQSRYVGDRRPSPAVVDALLAGPYGKKLTSSDLGPLMGSAARAGHLGIVRTMAEHTTGGGFAGSFMAAGAHASRFGNEKLAQFLKEKADAELQPYWELGNAISYMDAARKNPGNPDGELRDIDQRLGRKLDEIALRLRSVRLHNREATQAREAIDHLRSLLGGRLMYRIKGAIETALATNSSISPAFRESQRSRKMLYDEIDQLTYVLRNLHEIVALDRKIALALQQLEVDIHASTRFCWPMGNFRRAREGREALDLLRYYFGGANYLGRQKIFAALEGRFRLEEVFAGNGLSRRLNDAIATLRACQSRCG